MSFRKPAPAAPEKLPYVVQAEGWVQNVWRTAGEVILLPELAARYLVSADVLKSKADHDAAVAAAKEDAERAEQAQEAQEAPEAPEAPDAPEPVEEPAHEAPSEPHEDDAED